MLVTPFGNIRLFFDEVNVPFEVKSVEKNDKVYPVYWHGGRFL